MMWLIGAALACELATDIATLAEKGDKAAYLCVTSDPRAAEAITVALDNLKGEDLDGPRGRYTRALALWVLTQDSWNADIVRRLSASDRRLLADGVHARRGRASPSAEHAAAFANFGWYAPDPNYTNGRLTDEDREHIAMADKPPPPPPPPEPVARAEPPPQAGPASPPKQAKGVCGCDPTGSAVAGAWVFGLMALGWRTRRS